MPKCFNKRLANRATKPLEMKGEVLWMLHVTMNLPSGGPASCNVGASDESRSPHSLYFTTGSPWAPTYVQYLWKRTTEPPPKKSFLKESKSLASLPLELHPRTMQFRSIWILKATAVAHQRRSHLGTKRLLTLLPRAA